MKKNIRLIGVAFAAVALAHAAAWGIANAQTVEVPTEKTEHAAGWTSPHTGVIAVEGKIAGEWHHWLFVQRHNLNDYEERGFDPCYTSIVSDYKPVAKRLDDGTWEITFTSDMRETP